jgi:hypothetical protein
MTMNMTLTLTLTQTLTQTLAMDMNLTHTLTLTVTQADLDLDPDLSLYIQTLTGLTLNLLNSSNNHHCCNAQYETITPNLTIRRIQHTSPYHFNCTIKRFHSLNFLTLSMLAITCT